MLKKCSIGWQLISNYWNYPKNQILACVFWNYFSWVSFVLSECCMFRLNILSAVRRLFGTNSCQNRGREQWSLALGWLHFTTCPGKKCILHYIDICELCTSMFSTKCVSHKNNCISYFYSNCIYLTLGTELSTCSCKAMRSHGLKQRSTTSKINS